MGKQAAFAFIALITLGCNAGGDEAPMAGEGADNVSPTPDSGRPGADPWADVEARARTTSDSSFLEGLGGLLFRAPVPTGNGRACATCHVPEKNFTISPAEVEARFQKNPKDPLFRSIDADDFASDFTTLRTNALFRVTIPLPPNVSIVGSTAREVKIFRAAPTIFNTKLTAPYTVDGRELTLSSQAKGAALEHSRPRLPLPDVAFDIIALFEQGQFSSPIVEDIADAIEAGQTPPPVGQDYEGGPLTAEEQQGFAIFQQKCLFCHGGNTRGVSAAFPGNFFSIGISERNRAGLPTLQYDITNPDGSVTRTAPTPDPGRMLVTGKASDLNAFEMTQLRGISKTAPFFHDNSSPDMVSMLRHYNGIFPFVGIPVIPEEQFPVLIAYLNRL